jgi:hypothetical protein
MQHLKISETGTVTEDKEIQTRLGLAEDGMPGADGGVVHLNDDLLAFEGDADGEPEIGA